MEAFILAAQIAFWFSMITGIGLLILKKFGLSYLSEKGKNIATKQDIGEITEKIQEVQTSFQKELQGFIAQLNLLRVSVETRANAKIDALTSLFEKYTYFIQFAIDPDLVMDAIKTHEDLDGFYRKVDLAYSDIVIASGKIHLYIDHDQLYSASFKLLECALEYQNNVLEFTKGLSGIFFERDRQRIGGINPDYAKLKILLEKEGKVREDYKYARLETLKKTTNDVNNFILLFREYIKRLHNIEFKY